jgi:hypothetical protein
MATLQADTRRDLLDRNAESSKHTTATVHQFSAEEFAIAAQTAESMNVIPIDSKEAGS